MTLADMAYPEKRLRVPRIAYDDLRFLWVTDYRDDVRSGMLMYCGEECWYQVFAERENGASVYRSFAVLRLSPAQVADEMRWHGQLRERVGEGRNWEWWIEVYRERTSPDYSVCEVIGWFEC